MPDVVIRYQAEGGIADLGLAAELRLGGPSHADNVTAPRTVGPGLGNGRERRTIDTDISSAGMHPEAQAFSGLVKNAGKSRADRLGEADMGDDAFSEKRMDAICPVEELIGHDHVPGTDVLP